MGLFGNAAGAVLPFSILDLLDPDKAEAARFLYKRPQYMQDLASRLEKKDFSSGMDFGVLKGKRLRQWQQANSDFTEGPLKVSAKNIEKFYNKRIVNDHMEPEEFVDGLNSAIYGTRAKPFREKDTGNAIMFSPDGEGHVWRVVAAPHDGFSGLVTGYRYGVDDMKKELSSGSLGGRPLPPYSSTPVSGGGALPGRLTTVRGKESSSPINITPLPARVNAGSDLPAALGGASGAAAWPMQAADGRYIWPADMPGYVNTEPGLETPLVDPIDIAVAPIGAATWGGRAAAVAAEPVLSYGLDRMFGGIADMARQGQRPAENPAMAGMLQMLAERL